MLRAVVLAAALLGSFSLTFSPPAVAQSQTAKPWIGIEIDLGPKGVLVKGVRDKTPAAAAGLKVDDEIVAIDGTPVSAPAQLIERVQDKGVGTKVKLHLWRGGKELDVTLALAARPDELQMLRDTIVDKPARATQLEVMSAQGPVPAQAIDLAALKGDVVVVEFFATWCGPCRSSMPVLSKWQTTYGKKGLKVIGISAEEADVLHAFVAKNKLPYTITRDPEGKSTGGWAVPAIPTIVVIDRQGVVRYAQVGAGDVLDGAEAVFKPLLDQKK